MSIKVNLKSIGIVKSSLEEYSDVPVQSNLSNVKGKIKIFKEYEEGLKDLDGFGFIICISYLHKVKSNIPLQSTTHWDNQKHGVFAIRTPRRPNPIGFSIFRLLKIEGNILHVDNLDLINETPILDIKPFIPRTDNRDTEKVGWTKKFS